MCEEYEPYQERAGQPVVRKRSSSSNVPSGMKIEVLLDCAEPVQQNFHLQLLFGERIEQLSQQSKLGKCCMDAGFLHVVDIGKYFMTKDITEFSQCYRFRGLS